MKIREIISRVNKLEQFRDEVSVYDIANEVFGLSINYVEKQDRLVSYFIGNWISTDRIVGYRVLFFDDEPVAISQQIGRKISEEYRWLSKECYGKVRAYIITFLEEEISNFEICDLDEEYGSVYKIHYHGNLLDYHKEIALYNGMSVKIIERHTGNGYNARKEYEPSLVKIKLLDNTEKWIDVCELDFPFNLIGSVIDKG
jgi:hypothetical protein